MEMPGAFPESPRDSELHSTLPIYGEQRSTPSENAEIPLPFEAMPVEEQLPHTSSIMGNRSQTNGSNARTSTGRRRADNTSRTSRPTKPFAIAVFGATGTGKSSFISTLTGQQVGIGHGLKSCTDKIELVRYSLGLCNITLVDTPGFNDTYRSDTDVLREIAAWMEHAYDEKVPLSGVIYLHSITDMRMTGSSYRNLQMFRSLCGQDSLRNVVLASTMWDKVEPGEGERREKELLSEQGFWGNLVNSGAEKWRYDNTQGTATAMVNYLLQRDPVVLQIQKELVDENKALVDTSAGKSMSGILDMHEKRITQDIAIVKRDMTRAQEQKNREGQQELEEFRKDLEEKKRELEETRQRLRMPINKRSRWRMSWRCKKCGVRLKEKGEGPLEQPCPGCGCWQKFV